MPAPSPSSSVRRRLRTAARAAAAATIACVAACAREEAAPEPASAPRAETPAAARPGTPRLDRAPRPVEADLFPPAFALMSDLADRVDAAPDDPERWFDYARACHANRQFELAETAYRQVIARTDHADAWHLLAMVLEHVGRLAESQDAIRESIRIDPDQVAPYWILALWRLDDGALDEAESLFLEALRRRPGDAAATVGLARLRLQQQRPLEAVDLLTEHLLRIPFDSNARFILGTAHREAGNLDAAERELSRARTGGIVYRDDPVRAAMETFTRDPGREAEAAAALVDEGRVAEARARIDAIKARYPDNPALPVAEHRVLRAEGHEDEAIDVLRAAAELRDMSRYHYHLAWALRERARRDEATHDADLEEAEFHAAEAIRLPPNAGVEYGIHGLILQDLGRLDEAAEALRMAAWTTPGELVWARRAADALIVVKRWDDAVECLEHVVADAPEDASALYLLGASLANAGRAAEAEPLLARAIALAPDDPSIAAALDAVRAELDRPSGGTP